MSQLIVRKILGDNFDYAKIKEKFSEKEIQKCNHELMTNFSLQTKFWSKEKNSYWVLRNYLGVKMILSSSVMLSSLEFAIDKNLRVVEPYLIYYALLNCCRAIVFTSPNVEWNSGEVMTMTHTKIINLTVDSVNRFNKKEAKRVRNILEKARDYRELFSYKFPAKGINNFNVDSNLAIEECKFLSEIAQYQSAVLEKSYDKNVSDYLGLDWEILKHGYEYAGKNYDFVDREDGYRLDYIDRKQPRPFSLYMMMTEGMVEDFFGAWCPENDDMKQEVYNPDMNWQIIFPVP